MLVVQGTQHGAATGKVDCVISDCLAAHHKIGLNSHMYKNWVALVSHNWGKESVCDWGLTGCSFMVKKV